MKLMFALVALLAVTAHAGEYYKSLDLYQGFQLNSSKSTPIGFITKLKISGYALSSDLVVTNPLNTIQTFNTVSVLAQVKWEMGQGDSIYLSGQVSGPNKQLLTWLIYNGITKIDVEAEVMVFEYNSAIQAYDWSFGHKEILQGVLEKTGDELNLSVSDDASPEVRIPENFSFIIGFKPTVKQTISLCVSGRCTLRPWGFL